MLRVMMNTINKCETSVRYGHPLGDQDPGARVSLMHHLIHAFQHIEDINDNIVHLL